MHFRVSFRLAAAVVLAAPLPGCGGGSGPGDSSPKPVAEGVYFGLYTARGSATPIPVSEAVLPGDHVYFADIVPLFESDGGTGDG